MALGTAADARAATFFGIFGAAGVAVGAAVLAYLGTDHHATRLVAAGAVTTVLLLGASVLAGYAGAPRDFWIAGGQPDELRDWAWNGTGWRDEAEILDGTAQRYAKTIELDRQILALESLRVRASMWVAGAAVAGGLVVYWLFPHFS
jgi:hypothetical protein